MKSPYLILAFALASASALYGQMTFEKLHVEVDVPLDSDTLSIEFPFEVKGKNAVTIQEYEAACSCLSAEISEGGKLIWKPGEKGVVKGNFKLGTIKGTINKEIVLRLRNQPRPVRLKATLHIPELFVIDPPTLFWDLNGAGKAQTFKVHVKHDKPIKVTEIASTNEQFDYELKTLKNGWEYEVVVTPKTVNSRAFGLLRIRNDCGHKKHQSAQAFMVVRTPKVKPSTK